MQKKKKNNLSLKKSFRGTQKPRKLLRPQQKQRIVSLSLNRYSTFQTLFVRRFKSFLSLKYLIAQEGQRESFPTTLPKLLKHSKMKEGLFLSLLRKNSLLLSQKALKAKEAILLQLLNSFFNLKASALTRKAKGFGETLDKYGIIRVDTGFTNTRLSFTTLEGKVISWCSAGCVPTDAKRIRMSGRAITVLAKRFLKGLRKAKRKYQIKYIKVLFTGPSRRPQSKLFNFFRRRLGRSKLSILCREEGFRRSFNGCRLSRKKR